MPDPQQPKIIIDSDWKSQAQAEKERLAKEAEARKPAAPEGEPGQVTFEEICRMLAVQALSFLGEVPDPRTGQRVFAPELAKLYIDMLGVLEQKTKGNLTPEETEYFSGLLREVRLAFVEITKAVAKAVQEGKIKPSAAGAGAGLGVGPVPGAGPIPPRS